MNNIVSLISNALKDIGLRKYPNMNDYCAEFPGEYTLFVPDEDAHQQYLVIQNLIWDDSLDPSRWLLYQKPLYDILSKLIDKSEFHKNVSILVCVLNSGNKDPDKLERFILHLEEDIDYFKKLVLVYNANSATELNNAYKQSSMDFLSFVRKELRSYPDIEEALENPSQKLLLHLLIKLPLIQLPVVDYEPPSIEIMLEENITDGVLISAKSLLDKVDIREINEISLPEQEDQIEGFLDKWDCSEELA
ncbi:ABC-three component system middle component 1 [Desulfitobacterium metallireducens]|uniref:Uncharacterized protein n=1 Tax=Desulfitobacterium metallireducens DSM 15288 TaxID=871968 RepID=W0EGP0_9FIRM|nr:ABC-three component system middle component 1 [Desulfitobacterium metallireducens]AHF08369.1 hypothetical protein DESME_01005 [Desulfitobacterium metallireducens DSM 15288]